MFRTQFGVKEMIQAHYFCMHFYRWMYLFSMSTDKILVWGLILGKDLSQSEGLFLRKDLLQSGGLILFKCLLHLGGLII